MVGVGGIELYAITGLEGGVGSFHVAYARQWEFETFENYIGLQIFFAVVVRSSIV